MKKVMLLAVLLTGMVLVQGCKNEKEPWYINQLKKVSPEAKQEMMESRGLYIECDSGALLVIYRPVLR